MRCSSLLTKFYVDTLGADLTVMSIATFLAGVVASYGQLVVGYVSDRTRTRIGRRMPYLLIGAPLFGISLFFMLSPVGVHGRAASMWYMLWYCVFAAAGDIVNVSRNALGVEMTLDDASRAKLNGVSVGVGSFGLLIVAGISPVVTHALGAVGGMRLWGIILGISACATLWLVVWRIRESPAAFKRTAFPLVPGFRSCTHNRPWLIYLVSGSILGLMNEITGMFVFVLQYVMNVDPNDWFAPAAATYAVCQFLGVPIVTFLATKFGKLFVYRLSMVLIMCYGALGYLTTLATPIAFVGSLGFFGLSLAGLNVVGNVLLSDCVDYDELHTGKRRESTYGSLSSLPNKAASIAGRSVPLMVLSLLDYKQDAPQQNDNVIFALRCLVTLFPAALAAVAFCIFWRYPMNEEAHHAVVKAIADRAAGKAVVDPLTGKPVVLTSIVAKVSTSLEDGGARKALATSLADTLAAEELSIDADDTSGGLSAVEQAALADKQREEDTSPSTFLLYFSRRDLRMLASQWHARFIAKYVASIVLWLVHLFWSTYAAVQLFSDGNSQVAYLAVLAAAIASIAVSYEAARFKGVRWVTSQPRETLAEYVAKFTQSVAAVRDAQAAAARSGEGEDAPLRPIAAVSADPPAYGDSSDEDDAAMSVPRVRLLTLRVLARFSAIHLLAVASWVLLLIAAGSPPPAQPAS